MGNVNKFDIIISGAGLVGSVAAIWLHMRGFKVAVIDPKIEHQNFDRRTFSISLANKIFLDECGLWELCADSACRVDDIFVSDGRHSINFESNIRDKFGELYEAFGYMIESSIYMTHAKSLLRKFGIKTIAANLTAIQEDIRSVQAICDDGGQYTADVLIAADGKNSTIRNILNMKWHTKSYNQTALSFDIRHTKPHCNIAYEIFLKTGPLAVLPKSPDGGVSAVIATFDCGRAQYMQQNHNLLAGFLCEKCGDIIGECEIIGDIASYDLMLGYADEYHRGRVVFVGDAVHAIHPIAGQGLNLGLYDAQNLLRRIAENKDLGLDIAGQLSLREYGQYRCRRNALMIKFTDFINLIFLHNVGRVLAGHSFSVIDNIKCVKDAFAKHAMGVN